MALSTTEVEYIVITEAVNEALWLKVLAKELKAQDQIVIFYCEASWYSCPRIHSTMK